MIDPVTNWMIFLAITLPAIFGIIAIVTTWVVEWREARRIARIFGERPSQRDSR